MSLPNVLRLVVLLLLAAASGGCTSYLRQAVAGQFDLVRARQPVDRALADPATPAPVRARLATAQEALRFAHGVIGLPDNGSYRHLVMLDRPYVVWNVFAAPEFSLDLRTWCFPVAGCVGYRGYFREDDARDFAGRLSAGGDDVSVAGAAAYSTLGFFRDPLPSTLLARSDSAVAGLVFHELAHQRVYAGGDTRFNEGFATLVEQEALLDWLAARGDQATLCRYSLSLEREEQVQAIIADARRALRALYRSSGSPGDVAGRRAAKAEVFAQLRERYKALRAEWGAPPYFDAWFDGPLNNASLGAAGAYNDYVGTLRVVLESEGRRWPDFFARMDRLARLSGEDRRRVLAQITRPAPRRAPAGC